MNIKSLAIIIIFSLILIGQHVQAQFEEDALRLNQSNLFLTPRTAALGVAFYGISDDFGATMFNPAGLTLVGKNELSIGFGLNSLTSQVGGNFTGDNLHSNSGSLTNAGMVIPFKTYNTNGAISFGYVSESDYTNNMDGSYFNPQSTFINFEAQNGPHSIYDNLATYLLVADTINFRTPIKDSLRQVFNTSESGGMHDLVGGIAFDLTPNVSLGFTLVGKFGTYQYNRIYEEQDVLNKYNTFQADFSNIDFNRLHLEEGYTQDISGITGSVGLMARIEDFMRFGFTIKLPTVYNIDETFSQTAVVYFDDSSYTSPAWTNGGRYSYKLTTPFKYSAGLSFHEFNTTLSGAIEYSDASQLSFSDLPQGMTNPNSSIVQDLVGQTTWGVGAEYEFPFFPVVLRASYSSTSSPYQINIAGSTLINYSVGAGIYLAPNIRLDAVYRHSAVTYQRANYGTTADGSYYTYNYNPDLFGLQLTYRY